MKIESILVREGGTVVEIGGTTYHFRPSPADGGRHVAVVDNPLHAARFISITEGFRIAPDVEAPQEDGGEADEPAAERAGLVAAYEARFGRKPHHKLSDAKLREILSAPE